MDGWGNLPRVQLGRREWTMCNDDGRSQGRWRRQARSKGRWRRQACGVVGRRGGCKVPKREELPANLDCPRCLFYLSLPEVLPGVEEAKKLSTRVTAKAVTGVQREAARSEAGGGGRGGRRNGMVVVGKGGNAYMRKQEREKRWGEGKLTARWTGMAEAGSFLEGRTGHAAVFSMHSAGATKRLWCRTGRTGYSRPTVTRT